MSATGSADGLMDDSYLNQLRSRLDPSYHNDPPLPLPVADGESSASQLHDKQEIEDKDVIHSSGLESQVGSTVPLTEETNHADEEQPNLETEPKRRKKQKRKTKKKRKEEEEVEEGLAEGSMDIVDAITALEGTVYILYMYSTSTCKIHVHILYVLSISLAGSSARQGRELPGEDRGKGNGGGRGWEMFSLCPDLLPWSSPQLYPKTFNSRHQLC